MHVTNGIALVYRLKKKRSRFHSPYSLYFSSRAHHHSEMEQRGKLLILYDGFCPICCAKKAFLERRNHKARLAFADIRSEDFQSLEIPISFEFLEEEIHCICPDGRILRGMEVIRSAYREIGLGWLAAPTGWPLLKLFFDWLYQIVARNRFRISHFSNGRKR